MPDFLTIGENLLLPNSWKLAQDRKGMTGTRTYLVKESDVFDAGLPSPGDPWPGPPAILPWLLCISADWEGTASGKALCTYNYSTERQLGENFIEVSVSQGQETLDITRGYVWESAGTPVEIAIPTVIPVDIITIKVKTAAPPRAALLAARNKVNQYTYHGYAAGCLRYDGCDTDEGYDVDGSLTGVMSTHKFTGRDTSWQYAYREPLQAKTSTGQLRFWQSTDATAPDYTTNPALSGRPFM
jgi:hypothetical protein